MSNEQDNDKMCTAVFEHYQNWALAKKLFLLVFEKECENCFP